MKKSKILLFLIMGLFFLHSSVSFATRLDEGPDGINSSVNIELDASTPSNPLFITVGFGSDGDSGNPLIPGTTIGDYISFSPGTGNPTFSIMSFTGWTQLSGSNIFYVLEGGVEPLGTFTLDVKLKNGQADINIFESAGSGDQSDKITFSNAGDHGFITFESDSDGVAPIPGSLVLLGSGVLGLLGWRRLS